MYWICRSKSDEYSSTECTKVIDLDTLAHGVPLEGRRSSLHSSGKRMNLREPDSCRKRLCFPMSFLGDGGVTLEDDVPADVAEDEEEVVLYVPVVY